MKAFLLIKNGRAERYRQSKIPAVQAYLQKKPGQLEEMLRAEEAHLQSTQKVLAEMRRLGVEYTAVKQLELAEHAHSINSYDLAVSVGGDGTFLDLAHFVMDMPILGINSDIKRSVGNFCAATPENFQDYIMNSAESTKVWRLQASINGKIVPEPALNEVLLASTNPAEMSRYVVKACGQEKEMRSSGLIVCTAAGSTAWMSKAGGIVLPITSKSLEYHSRETGERKFEFAESVSVLSLCPEGKIYMDGNVLQYEANIGTQLIFKPGSPLAVLGNLSRTSI